MLKRPSIAALLQAATLSLVTFIAVGASWQLAAAAAPEDHGAPAAQPRAQLVARGNLPSTVTVDTRLVRATLTGLAFVLGGGVPVSVVQASSTRSLRVPLGATVAEAVALAGVTLGPLDRTDPSDPAAIVGAGGVVRVVRVAATAVVVQEPTPFPTETVPDPTLLRGRSVVVREGSEGLAENTYRVTTADGAEESRVLVASAELQAPVSEVRRVGTAIPAPPAAPGEIQAIITAAAARWGADASQLLRVAYCESHYNPNAYNSWSGASGLFQFLAGTWAGNSVRAGYGGASPFDPVANANTAAMMFAAGQAGQWVCR